MMTVINIVSLETLTTNSIGKIVRKTAIIELNEDGFVRRIELTSIYIPSKLKVVIADR